MILYNSCPHCKRGALVVYSDCTVCLNCGYRKDADTNRYHDSDYPLHAYTHKHNNIRLIVEGTIWLMNNQQTIKISNYNLYVMSNYGIEIINNTMK